MIHSGDDGAFGIETRLAFHDRRERDHLMHAPPELPRAFFQ